MNTKKAVYPTVFFLSIVALFISAASFSIGRTSMEREIATQRKTAAEKTPGLVVISDKVLTMDELDRICEIIESGGRRIVEIRSLLDDEIQYRIRFKNNKQEEE